jgi:hypothetical protein
MGVLGTMAVAGVGGAPAHHSLLAAAGDEKLLMSVLAGVLTNLHSYGLV